jgi:hypothetical protein
MSKGSGISRSDRRRNARKERLRALLPRDGAVMGIDLGEAKQALCVIDHDERVLWRKTVRVQAHQLGGAVDLGVAAALERGFGRVATLLAELLLILYGINDPPDGDHSGCGTPCSVRICYWSCTLGTAGSPASRRSKIRTQAETTRLVLSTQSNTPPPIRTSRSTTDPCRAVLDQAQPANPEAGMRDVWVGGLVCSFPPHSWLSVLWSLPCWRPTPYAG